MTRIDFALNFNTLGPPKAVFSELIARFGGEPDEWPAPSSGLGRTIVQELFSVDREHVAVTADVTDALTAILTKLGTSRVGVFAPAPWRCALAAERMGASLAVYAPADPLAWHPEDPEVHSHLRSCDTAFLANPSNPTGQVLTRENIEGLLRAAPRCHLIVDETFLHFRGDYAARSAIPLLARFDRLTVISSLSNVLGVPGLPIGFAAGTHAFFHGIRDQIAPFGISRAASVVLEAVMRERTFISSAQRFYDRERIRVASLINERSNGALRVRSAETCFLFVEVFGEGSVAELTARLARQGMTVRKGIEFGKAFERFIRISLLGTKENDLLVRALAPFDDVESEPRAISQDHATSWPPTRLEQTVRAASAPTNRR